MNRERIAEIEAQIEQDKAEVEEVALKLKAKLLEFEQILTQEGAL